jgi:hypothetical protein
MMPDENSMFTVLPKLTVSPDVKVILLGAALPTGMNVKALAIINAVKSKATALLLRFLFILLSPI